MRKKKILLMSFIVIFIVITSAQLALGYGLSGKKWSNPKAVTYSYMTGTPVAYTNAINSAASAWNNNCSKVYTAYNTSSVVKYSLVNDSSTTIDGNTSLRTSGSTIVGANTWFNTYWGDSYDASGKQGLVAHEMGHIWGLLDSSNSWAVMVVPSSLRQYYGTDFPRADDINGINAIYP